MGVHFNVFGLDISTYGFMLVIALAVANAIAYFLVKKYGLDIYDFIILETYAGTGGFVGAKLLFLWVSRGLIDWSRFFEFRYFMDLMRGGFVFYGGLIGAIIVVFIMGKVHKIDTIIYLKKFIFLFPLMHGIGRIGCFLVGCCHGMPYDGWCAVTYPQDSLAPVGIKLFPVQLIEAIGLFVIALVLYIIIARNKKNAIETYLVLYSILRFVLEYFRDDSIRGRWLQFSTSQWISIIIVIVVVAELVIRVIINNRRKTG